MSLQDDYFNLSAELKEMDDRPELSQMLEAIWDRFCENETELLELRDFNTSLQELLKHLTGVRYKFKLITEKENG